MSKTNIPGGEWVDGVRQTLPSDGPAEEPPEWIANMQPVIADTPPAYPVEEPRPDCRTHYAAGVCWYHERREAEAAHPAEEPHNDPLTTRAGKALWGDLEAHGYGEQAYYQIRAIERMAAEAAHPATEGLDVDGVVAELVGVEAALEDAHKRLGKATSTLGGIARLSSPEGQK